MKNRNPTKRLSELIEVITSDAMDEPVLSPGKNKHDKPGDFIKRLSPMDRQMLQQAKSKDFYCRFYGKS